MGARWNLALLGLVLVAASCTVQSQEAQPADKEWWETALFYQIYPRSFYDTNDDGVGDVRGVTAKLQYLKDTGIDATWLSPIFSSPQEDFGYDVSDFKQVDPLFGTNADLEQLFAEANKLGLKIVLDFVPNHTSNKHQWFIDSEKGIAPYRDYYVWRPARNVNGQRMPPNNWVSLLACLLVGVRKKPLLCDLIHSNRCFTARLGSGASCAASTICTSSPKASPI